MAAADAWLVKPAAIGALRWAFGACNGILGATYAAAALVELLEFTVLASAEVPSAWAPALGREATSSLGNLLLLAFGAVLSGSAAAFLLLRHAAAPLSARLAAAYYFLLLLAATGLSVASLVSGCWLAASLWATTRPGFEASLKPWPVRAALGT